MTIDAKFRIYHLRYAESLIKKSVNQHSQFKIDFKRIKLKKMDDFSFEDAGDQLDDDMAEAMRVSLAEATAPSPHSANQGMFSNKINFYYLIVFVSVNF